MKHLKLAFLGLLVTASLATPFAFAFAQTAVGNDDPKNKAFQLVPCTGVVASSTNPNGQKECDFAQLLVLFNRIVSFLLYMSIPLVLGMIMYTGFMYVTANGDPGKLAKAKKMIIPVVIGLFWVLGAYIVVYTVLDNLLQDTVGGEAKGNVIFLNMFK